MPIGDCVTSPAGRIFAARFVAFEGDAGTQNDDSSARERQTLLPDASSDHPSAFPRSHSFTTSTHESCSFQGDPHLRTSKSYQSIASAAKARGFLHQTVSILEQERVWYDNYTAIDWHRDNVLSRRRIEDLKQKPGLRGRLFYLMDAVQGWVLCFLIGISTAILAFLIMVSEVLLFSIKSGYCRTSLLSSHKGCSEGDFQYWSDLVTWRFSIYLASATTFAVVASCMTMSTLTIFPNGKKLYCAAGSGIPEIKTILSGFIIHGFLGVKTLVVKAIGLTLSVATGMNLGKEGPFVHIACCAANILTRYFPKFYNNEAKRRETLSSACSAGVAVAFGAPIGGVLFALEEVSYYFPPKVIWRSFFTAAVAAVTLKILNPLGTGKVVLLETNYEKIWHVRELPVYIFIGLNCGLYGALFCKLNILWAKSFRTSTYVAAHPIIEVAAICIISTSISYWNEWTQIGGTELVDYLLSECMPEVPSSLCASNVSEYPPIIRSLLWALLWKILLTIVTFGVPAGIFIPTMCIGAIFGRIIGLFLQRFYNLRYTSWLLDSMCQGDAQECIVPGIYAMIGAAGALAGVTRMTVSLAVIMFELTGSLNYVMPFMVCILTAKWTADAIQPKGIYDLIIDLNDHPYLDAKESHLFGQSRLTDLLPPKDTLSKTSVDISYSATIRSSELRAKILWARKDSYEDGGIAIVRHGQLVGYIALADLALSLDLCPDPVDDEEFLVSLSHSSASSFSRASRYNESSSSRGSRDQAQVIDLSSIVDPAPLTLSKEAPLEMALEMFTKLGLRYLAIVDAGEFLGIIHKKKFVRFLREMQDSPVA